VPYPESLPSWKPRDARVSLTSSSSKGEPSSLEMGTATDLGEEEEEEGGRD